MALRNDSDADWERFGAEQPYFGVYADPRFRRENLTDEALAEFFASGETHIAALFSVIEASFRPGFRPRRALDFGCGVGRGVIPLAARATAVVGVDVAPSMIAEAKRNLAARGIANVTVTTADDSLAALEGTFDLVHSFIVFQHVAPRRGERLLARLVDRLEEGGIGVVQLTFATDQPLRSRLVAWARRTLPLFHAIWNWRHGKRFDAPWMQMNRYDVNRVLGLLQDRGCHRCVLRFTEHFGHRGVVLFFAKASEPSFPGPTRTGE